MDGLIEGRVVHYVIGENIHRAAIVINVHSKELGTCDLFVFSMPQDERGGFFMKTNCDYADTKISGTWHWIEKA